MESGSVKTPALHGGVFRAEPLSTDADSVYLLLLHQAGGVDKILAVVQDNEEGSEACNSPEEHVGQGFCPSVT